MGRAQLDRDKVRSPNTRQKYNDSSPLLALDLPIPPSATAAANERFRH